jgi:hypothetical protein
LVPARQAERDGDFTDLTLGADFEDGFVVVRLHGLHPTGVGEALVANTIPGIIVGVACFAFDNFRDRDNLILAKGFPALAAERGNFVHEQAAHQDAPVTGRRFCKGQCPVYSGFGQEQSQRTGGAQFQEIAAGERSDWFHIELKFTTKTRSHKDIKSGPLSPRQTAAGPTAAKPGEP